MSITCDYCGKKANAKDCPPDMHWFEWVMDKTRGNDAIVNIPTETGEISGICFECLGKVLNEKEKGN